MGGTRSWRLQLLRIGRVPQQRSISLRPLPAKLNRESSYVSVLRTMIPCNRGKVGRRPSVRRSTSRQQCNVAEVTLVRGDRPAEPSFRVESHGCLPRTGGEQD